MTNLNAWKMAGAVLMLCGAMAIVAPAQSFKTLAQFDGADGSYSLGSFVQGRDGNLYGTTNYGGGLEGGCGSQGCGTAFKMGPAGKLTTLYDFCATYPCSDGARPWAGLVLAANGDLYGTTAFYGANSNFEGGTIYRITQAGLLTTIYSFCSQPNCTDGSFPWGTLIQATDGDLYGTTVKGGNISGEVCSPYGCGTVFKITPSGTFSAVYRFCSHENCADGSAPLAGVIQGTNGSFYGTTAAGGVGDCGLNGGCGTVFKLTPGGQLTTLHNFNGGTDGESPQAGLVEATDGNFYGTTLGGESALGTIFMITPAGALTTLHNFDLSDGAYPSAALVQATDGSFYGATQGGGTYLSGTLFKISSDGAFTTIYNFCPHKGCSDGTGPEGALLQSTRGFFYGMTPTHGVNGDGTTFGLNEGLDPFVAFVQSAGKVGQTGGILGQGFTGTTSVAINGIPASFTVISDTFLGATVPAGATTGYVTVTTPSGVLTSNVPFHVLP
jgi:uncharacterized repeat protein (TIGR03803 family)